MSEQFTLTAKIIALSVANTWSSAKREWAVETIYMSDELGTCLCGHYPITEHCLIRNRLNGNLAEVGNVCVRKFLGLKSDTLFRSIKQITADITRTVNGDMLDYAHRKGWVNEWECTFYMDTMRRRRLSQKQQSKREQINRKILTGVEQVT